MKYLIYFLILVSIISCNNTQTKEQDQIVNNEKTITDNLDIEKEELKLDSIIETEIENEDDDDCIFDQTYQTDEFLKGKNEFENYIWDSISKTATIILDNNDTLLIRRGGCYSFGVSAEFRLRIDQTDYSNWNNVYERILWISKILESEFSYSNIKSEIDSSKVIIDNDIVSFSNVYLQDNNYEIVRRIDNELNVIILSYYIN